jgi:hypothetical protein
MTTISVNGTDYPIKFGRMALIAIMKLTNAKGLSELSKLDSLSPEKWGDFVLAGLENGCKVEKIQAPTLAEVNDELDTNPQLYMEAINVLGADITPADKPVAEGN